jgi:phage protein D
MKPHFGYEVDFLFEYFLVVEKSTQKLRSLVNTCEEWELKAKLCLQARYVLSVKLWASILTEGKGSSILGLHRNFSLFGFCYEEEKYIFRPVRHSAQNNGR